MRGGLCRRVAEPRLSESGVQAGRGSATPPTIQRFALAEEAADVDSAVLDAGEADVSLLAEMSSRSRAMREAAGVDFSSRPR